MPGWSIHLDRLLSQSLNWSDAPVPLSSAFTFETWVKFNQLPTGGAAHHLWTKGTTHATAQTYFVNITSFTPLLVNVGVRQDANVHDARYYEFPGLVTGSWYHLAVTCDTTQPAASTFAVYVGTGSLTPLGFGATEGNSANITGTTNPNMLANVNFSNSAYANVYLSETRIWNHTRSLGQVTAFLNTRLIGDEPGLWAYFPFNSSSIDFGPNGFTTTTPSGSTFVQDTPLV